MKNNLNKKNNKGFTLIELLVVISIISLLSTVVLGALNESRAKAEYKRFAQDLDSFQKAMQLYYQDNNSYPLANSVTTGINNVSEVLIDNKYLGADLSYVDSTSYETNSYYAQNDTPGWADSCGPDGSITNGPGDYTLFIVDSTVDYTSEISSRFQNTYYQNSIVPNTYCIHF